jgi:hypothetical protein
MGEVGGFSAESLRFRPALVRSWERIARMRALGSQPPPPAPGGPCALGTTPEGATPAEHRQSELHFRLVPVTGLDVWRISRGLGAKPTDLEPAGAGTSRYGIYAHRPETCRTYPMVKRPAGAVVHQEAMCPADAWPDGGSPSSHWLPAIDLLESDLQTYRGVVATWNQQVCGDRCGVRSLEEFCQFLLDSYDALRSYGRLPEEAD